jgi:ribosomal protein S18 acetylase RimI-like enzyme
MPEVKPLVPDEWLTLRNIRLAALRDSPDVFLATYEQQEDYTEDQWRAEFNRGSWHIGFEASRPVGLLGVTREPEMPAHECYLEYIWVDPECRGRSVALEILTAVLDVLRAAGVQTAFLWVLDGNDVAMRLYKRAGFIRTNDRQPLAARPGRTEERLRLDLG